MIRTKLKFELIIGYFLLVSIQAVIIYLVYKEQGKKNVMEQQEIHWQRDRWLTNQAFVQLLDLTAMGEIVVGWTEEDYIIYQKKYMETTALLQKMKIGQNDELQRTCVDSICSLLAKKERQIVDIFNQIKKRPDVGNIVHKERPVSIQKTKQQMQGHALSSETDNMSAFIKKKRNSFWSIFRRKEEKSVYAQQWEKSAKRVTSPTINTKIIQSPALLYSLEKEINDTIRLYEKKRLSMVDSLKVQNRLLNGRLNVLIQNFKKKEMEIFCREIEKQQSVRNRSFQLITGTCFGAFLLVIILYIILHRDVNRRYRYQMELELSSRRNEELSQSQRNILLTVNHDLCAPLSVINGYAELIPEEKEELQRNRYAENIIHASRHAIGLANNLLYYYRLETGKEQPDKVTFFLGRVIEDVVHSFHLQAEKKGLGLTMKTEGVNTMVEGDRLRLSQILNNLLANAIKFTQTGYVHVGVHYANGQLSFFVRDTGKGISRERQKDIFKAFERLDAGSIQPGFGLGLTITARLVDMLGGTIRVESIEEHGSSFEVCLPMQEAGKPETNVWLHEKYDCLSGLKVILMEDDRMQADMTRRMLERKGIACDCCYNIMELIEWLRRKQYDLLLTDLQMPEMDGYRVLALLRNSNIGQSKDIPILAVTAEMDKGVDRLQKEGFTGYLHKPFSIDELLVAIVGCMVGRKPQRQEPDFTPLIEGEDDRQDILGMFVQDTEKTVDDLYEAIETKNYTKISILIHKGAPLWETIRIGISASELERLASLPPEAWGEEMLAKVRELATVLSKSVELAKKLKEDMK